MRRALFVGAPILILLAAGGVIGILRAESKNPLDPLRSCVAEEETTFVPGNAANGGPQLQVIALLKGSEMQSRIDAYRNWLRENPGWRIHGELGSNMRVNATHGTSIVPDAWLSVEQNQGDQQLLFVYNRQLSPLEALVDGRLYKHLDYNSPPFPATHP